MSSSDVVHRLVSRCASRGGFLAKPLAGSREQVWKQRQKPCGEDEGDDVRARLAAAVDDLWRTREAAELKTYASLLQQCADAGELLQGERIHAHILEWRLPPDRYVSNFLVHMYGKCKRLAAARTVFESTRKRNVFSYTILVDAYAENGEMQRAREVFDRMPSRNAVTWTSLVSGYGKNGQPELSRRAFDDMPERGRVAWTAMITAYAQNGDFARALEVFKLMDLEGSPADDVTFLSALDACTNLGLLSFGRQLQADAEACGLMAEDPKVCNSLMNLYGKCGCCSEARAIFDKMDTRTTVSWSTMIAVYAQNGRPDKARAVFDEIPLKNVVCWNTVLTAYAENGHGEKALNMFKLMDLEGTPADAITFLSVLDACAAMPSLAAGRILHREVEQHNTMSGELRVANAMLNMYSRCGSLRDVVAAFGRMKERDLLSWNTMAAAYAHLGHGEKAVDLLRDMAIDGMHPDGITFIAVLSGCCHAGLLLDGVVTFGSMEPDYGVPAERDHYNCVVDLLCRASMLHHAEEVASSGHGDDAVPWTTLLNACKAHSDVDRAARAAEKASELAPTVSAPYVMLSGLYKHAYSHAQRSRECA